MPRLPDFFDHPLRSYSVAIGAAIVTTTVMVPLRPLLHPFVLPPFLFLVLLVAWVAGFGPAIVAWAVSVAALAYFFVRPHDPNILGEQDVMATVVFTVVAMIMAWLAATVRRGRDERVMLLAREAAARVAAQEANQAKDEFLAILGHEFRTPLAAMRAALRLLETGGDDDDTAGRSRAIIRRQVDQLARMVDDLLDVNRIVSGEIVLDRRPVDLAEAVSQSMATVIAAWTTKGHRFNLEVEPVWVEADAARIERILVNLLDNAVKYTQAGGSILIRVKPDGTDALVEVRDTGMGIPQEVLPRIFDLFVRAEGQTRGGLGIGLAVVRRLVELHGGSIRAASDGPGRGSRFTVTLPRVPRPPRRQPAPDRSPVPAQPAC